MNDSERLDEISFLLDFNDSMLIACESELPQDLSDGLHQFRLLLREFALPEKNKVKKEAK